MYYKIENKECDVYKQLHELRTKEREIEESNHKLIQEKTGGNYGKTFGRHGQQNFWRVSRINGFEFFNTENVCLKTWREDKKNKGIYIPNMRFKLGKEMNEFLINLPASNFNRVLKILKLEDLREFTFPFVEIEKDLIIIYLGEGHEPKDKNVIEITKTEFNKIRGIKTK